MGFICYSYNIFCTVSDTKLKKADFKSEERNVLIMASKHEELLGLISELQCYECKNVPGPNVNQNNRYSCTDSAHTLCEEHKNNCPCGSLVGKSPSPIMAKLLQNLPWMCQNYKNGCCESKMNREDLEHHQEKCIYRLVVCPNYCKEDGKVLFKDVFDHLTICMEKPIHGYKMSDVEANKFHISFETNKFDLEDGESWFPSKMTSTCGAVFFINGFIENKTVYIWICLLGSADEAKKYSCTYSVRNEIGEKFIYTGPVLTIDKGKDDAIASGSLLIMGTSAVQRSLNKRKQSDGGSEGETGSNPLVFLRNQEEFQQMKRLLHQDAEMLTTILQNIKISNPELLEKIHQNQEAFIQMINDSDEELNVDITIRNLKEEAKDDDMESGVSDGE